MTIQSLYEIIHWNAKIIDATSTTIPDVVPNGVITELELPKLIRELDTTKRAGELGIVSRLKHFGQLEMSFTTKANFPELGTAIAKATQTSATIQLTACLTEDNGTSKAYIVKAKGFSTEVDLGKFSEAGYDASHKFSPWYLDIAIGTTYTLIYDPRNYILSVNGLNLFQSVKDILEPPVAPI